MAHFSFDGPRLKVARAREQIDSLRKAEVEFLEYAEYTVVPAEINPKTGNQVYRVRAPVSPPQEWGVAIGEIAHNLRSALDGLIYQLAVANNHKEPKRTQFPIFLVGRPKACRGQCSSRKARNHFWCRGREMIRLLHKNHQTSIEWLQPYKGNGPKRLNFIYLLSEINNADKHRLIQVTVPRWRNLAFSMTVSDEAVGLPPLSPQFKVLKHGAKVMEAGAHVSVKPEISSNVVFWQGCSAVKYLPVHETLAGCCQRTSDIIETFAKSLGE